MPFDHFGFIAPFYNRLGEYAARAIMMKAAGLPARGRLLDVGGGTGRVAATIRDQAAQVIVADISMGMLHFAASKPGLLAAAAASEQLPFADESFDRVIMVDALHHVIDQARTAAELLRVLAPGGRIVIEEPDLRNLGVKLIALAEKALLMRSHFLPPSKIACLFHPAKTSIASQDSSAWVIVEKQ